MSELVQLLAKYDWNSPIPPRGYQYGFGRGARPFTTIGEASDASKRSEALSVDIHYLDFVVGLTEKSEKKKLRTESEGSGSTVMSTMPKLDLQDIVTIPLAKKALVKKSAREQSDALDSTASAIAIFADERSAAPAPLELVSHSKNIDTNDPNAFSDEQLSTLLTYGSDEDQAALIVRAKAHLQLHGVRRALAVLEDGCARVGQQGPQIWLERLKLMAPLGGGSAAARVVAEDAVKACPKSEELWRRCIDLQPTTLRRDVLQRAVVEFPECEPLWTLLLDDTPNPADQKKILKKAIALRPDLPILWVSLANLETHENGRKLLAAAVEQCPASAQLLSKAAAFEAKHGDYTMVRVIVRQAYQHFVAAKLLPHEEWMSMIREMSRIPSSDHHLLEVGSEMLLADVLQEQVATNNFNSETTAATMTTRVSSTWLDDVVASLGYDVLDDGAMLHMLALTIIKLEEVSADRRRADDVPQSAAPALPALAQLIITTCTELLPREAVTIPLLRKIVLVYAQTNIVNLIFVVRVLYDMDALNEALQVVMDGIARCPRESLLFVARAKIEAKTGVKAPPQILQDFRQGIEVAPTPYLYKKMLVFLRAACFSALHNSSDSGSPRHSGWNASLGAVWLPYEEALNEAVGRFPTDHVVWLMLLQHRACVIDQLRHQLAATATAAGFRKASEGGGGIAEHRDMAAHIRRLQELAQQALLPEHVRHSPVVWAYIAHSLNSELLLNVHAARATLLEAGEVFAGRMRDDDLAPIHMARINIELKHGGRNAALSAARDAITASGSRHASVVAAFIDLEVPVQRPKAAYTSLTVWRVRGAEVYLATAKVYFLAKLYERADDQVRKALEQNGRCGDAHAMKYRLVSESIARTQVIVQSDGGSDITDSRLVELRRLQSDAVAEAVKAQPNSGPLWISLAKERGFGENVTLTGSRAPVSDILRLCAQSITFV